MVLTVFQKNFWDSYGEALRKNVVQVRQKGNEDGSSSKSLVRPPLVGIE
jgi:hypothetical protein